MNSWHSWSPNGRWLVFSTKVFSPYTQLALAQVIRERVGLYRQGKPFRDIDNKDP